MNSRHINLIPIRALAGGSGGDFALARFNSDGSVDTTWASSGKKIQNLGSAGEYVSGMAIDSNGKIVVGGTVGTTNSDWGIARLNNDGTLDTTFNTVGYVVTAFSAGVDVLQSIAVDANNKIVAVGAYNGATLGKFAMARYTTAGALDTTFDTDGKVLGSTNFQTFWDVAIQSDGKIVTAGFAVQKFLLERYTSAGALDTSFDGDGHVEVTVVSGTGTGAYALAIQSNGKIVAAGVSDSDVAVARVESNGALDTSFAGDGTLTIDFGTSSNANDVAVNPTDGSLILVGAANNDVLLAKVHASGALSERLYVVHDANFNVTAVTDTDALVLERYLFDPYGTRAVLDANWAVDTDGLSDVIWLYGHQGGRHDLGAGLEHFRYRDLDTSLGRWTRQDPLGYLDGLSRYAYAHSTPARSLDPAGLYIIEWAENQAFGDFGAQFWHTHLKFRVLDGLAAAGRRASDVRDLMVNLRREILAGNYSKCVLDKLKQRLDLDDAIIRLNDVLAGISGTQKLEFWHISDYDNQGRQAATYPAGWYQVGRSPIAFHYDAEITLNDVYKNESWRVLSIEKLGNLLLHELMHVHESGADLDGTGKAADASHLQSVLDSRGLAGVEARIRAELAFAIRDCEKSACNE